MPYQFLDAYSSVLTADSSVVGGAHRPIVQIGSVLSAIPVTPSGNQSVSGTVGASIIGLVPVSFSGAPSISGTVNIAGNPSISGTVNIAGSVATIIIGGSILTSATANQSVSGTVNTLPLGTIVTSIVSTVPSSVLFGASIFGQLPAGTAVMGSVATLQGTNPWIITGSVQGFPTNQNVSGSVVAFVNANSSSIYGMRNDAVASFLGADLTERPIATDSAGRVTVKPFAAEESRIEGYVTLTSTSLTTLVAAAGAGLRNYITDLWFANTGATTTLVTFSDSAASILGYTIAPTASGSNLPGLLTPIRTGANASFNIQAGSNTSTLYATVKGFKAP